MTVQSDDIITVTMGGVLYRDDDTVEWIDFRACVANRLDVIEEPGPQGDRCVGVHRYWPFSVLFYTRPQRTRIRFPNRDALEAFLTQIKQFDWVTWNASHIR